MEIKISVSQKLKILIYPGLHARPGSEFVKYCQQFDSDVEIKVGDKTANGKSLLSLFKIEPKQFSIIDLHITGSDEEELMENLINWKTEAYSSKDDFDNENIEEEELKSSKDSKKLSLLSSFFNKSKSMNNIQASYC